MSLSLLNYLGLLPPCEVQSADELKRGRVIATGVLACTIPLRSPIHARDCAGFLYNASHLGWRTYGPSTRKPLLRALVYAPSLYLMLGDGTKVSMVPRQQGEMDEEGHQRLLARDLPGFRATESLLPLGSTVRVQGMLSRRDDHWTMRFGEAVVLEERSPEARRST